MADSGLTFKGRIAGGSGQPEVDREQPLILPAAENAPDHRHLREGVVERVGGNEGAGQIDPVAAVIHLPLHREADQRAPDHRVAQIEALADAGEIPRSLVNCTSVPALRRPRPIAACPSRHCPAPASRRGRAEVPVHCAR